MITKNIRTVYEHIIFNSFLYFCSKLLSLFSFTEKTNQGPYYYFRNLIYTNFFQYLYEKDIYCIVSRSVDMLYQPLYQENTKQFLCTCKILRNTFICINWLDDPLKVLVVSIHSDASKTCNHFLHLSFCTEQRCRSWHLQGYEAWHIVIAHATTSCQSNE